MVEMHKWSMLETWKAKILTGVVGERKQNSRSLNQVPLKMDA